MAGTPRLMNLREMPAGMLTGSPSEAELIACILGGEKELFHDLIRPYERMAYLTCFAILKNETEAEDAAQEAIINAYRHLGSFRGDAKFSTWLVTIAMNEGRKRLRKARAAKEESLNCLIFTAKCLRCGTSRS